MKNQFRVVEMTDRHRRSVVCELEELLDRARSGHIVGIGYAVTTSQRSIEAGLAGTMSRDRNQAAGALFGAAVRASDDWS